MIKQALIIMSALCGVILPLHGRVLAMAGAGRPPAIQSDAKTTHLEATNATPAFGQARLVFMAATDGRLLNPAHIPACILVQYARTVRTKGTVQRWPGDTAGQYEYKVIQKREFIPANLVKGRLELLPGFYQIEHQSVSGEPPSGMYGKSDFFEIRSGEEAEVQVLLYPAL